ncbi:MAG: energy-coupling factor ABC transporter ATP-binding protein [Coriobacteriales bacterium]|jgi:cobalt/nickel transport system ATP-binding protein|nr:energy-coupling factor ABC transporter ATP-binding protein [Coriobacteriales bacterium]
MTEILRVENISYKYEDKYLAVNNVSVNFSAGELVAVLGSNGAGKSTFFLCCNGVLRPQTGHIYLHGEEVSTKKQLTTRLRQSVGLVFQDPDSQIIAGSVESEVSFGPMNLGLPFDEVRQRVDESLQQMDIVRYRDFAPQYLSGGEKKRVSIADILAMRSEMILLDEPTASLDPKNADALEQILRDLSQMGITIVISTHDVDFAYRIAERVIVFAKGEIIADDKPDIVFASQATLERAGLKKPLLFEAWETVRNGTVEFYGQARPRTIEEFRDLLAGNIANASQRIKHVSAGNNTDPSLAKAHTATMPIN